MAKRKKSKYTPAQRAKIEKVFHEWGQGELHSGTGRKGKKREEPVPKGRQDIAAAIAMSEAGVSRKSKRGGGRKTSRGGRR